MLRSLKTQSRLIMVDTVISNRNQISSQPETLLGRDAMVTCEKSDTVASTRSIVKLKIKKPANRTWSVEQEYGRFK